jgi:acyl carrier protein
MDELKVFIQNEVMNLAFVKVGFDDSLIKSKLLDSISVVDLLVSIEDEIGQKIPQYLIKDDNFDTINIIIETLSKLES